MFLKTLVLQSKRILPSEKREYGAARSAFFFSILHVCSIYLVFLTYSEYITASHTLLNIFEDLTKFPQKSLISKKIPGWEISPTR